MCTSGATAVGTGLVLVPGRKKRKKWRNKILVTFFLVTLFFGVTFLTVFNQENRETY
jgi:hypothetical protein